MHMCAYTRTIAGLAFVWFFLGHVLDRVIERPRFVLPSLTVFDCLAFEYHFAEVVLDDNECLRGSILLQGRDVLDLE